MRRAIYFEVLLSLLLQLRLLQLLRVLRRSAAATAATAVCCHGFLKVGLPEAANNHYGINGSAGRVPLLGL